MNKKIISSLFVALIATVSFSAQAATLNYAGSVTGATGAFAALTPVGTPVGGDVEVDAMAFASGLIGVADISDIGVAVGGFCFTFGAGMCAGSVVPITSIDTAAITNVAGVLGGSFSVTAFSPTFMLAIPIFFDIDAGTFSASAAGLGTVDGIGSLTGPAPVPVPAAVWLFGSALLGMMGIRRRG